MSNARYDLDEVSESPVNREVTRLLYVTSAKYGGDWHSLMHTHACTELFYVVGGQGQFKVEDRLIPVKVDDLMIVNPNVAHTEMSLNQSPLEYIVLGVEGLEFAAAGEENRSHTLFSLSGSREEVLPYLRGMLREIETKLKGYQVVCQDLLEVLVLKLLRHTDFSLTVTPGRMERKECVAVKRYLDGHFKDSITLDQLSELVHMNKYYLVHAFRREYDTTPISYLIDQRIQESKYLLSSTDHSLSQISQMLGFSSPSYFSQSFRRVTDMSPQEYRRCQRGASAG